MGIPMCTYRYYRLFSTSNFCYLCFFYNKVLISIQNLPPIRNKAFKKKKKSKSKVPSKTTTEENKKNKIKSYDYEAWGKLDVVS